MSIIDKNTAECSGSKRVDFIYENDLKGDCLHLCNEVEENRFEVKTEGVK